MENNAIKSVCKRYLYMKERKSDRAFEIYVVVKLAKQSEHER